MEIPAGLPIYVSLLDTLCENRLLKSLVFINNTLKPVMDTVCNSIYVGGDEAQYIGNFHVL